MPPRRNIKVDSDYTIRTHDINGQYTSLPWKRATATITFSNRPALDETIIIISHNGTKKTYTVKSSATVASGQFARGADGSPQTAAASLKLCIEHANGHNGAILVFHDGAGNLTLTQAKEGEVGNTVITEALTNVTATNFAGGSDNPGAGVRQPPFILSSFGRPSLRVHPTGSVSYPA